MIKNNNFNLSAFAQICNNHDVRVKHEHDKKVEQCGRSMIEMLGVLAIVGVLSVGGIAGYSKAMTKFKINKTAEQISHIATNIRTLYAQQTTYEGLNSSTALQMGILPDSLNSSNLSATSFQNANPFNGNAWVEGYNDGFIIIYNGIPTEACVTLATYDWGSTSSSGLVALGFGQVSYGAFPNKKHDSPCEHGYSGCGVDNLPVPVATVASTCDCEPYGCDIALKFQ